MQTCDTVDAFHIHLTNLYCLPFLSFSVILSPLSKPFLFFQHGTDHICRKSTHTNHPQRINNLWYELSLIIYPMYHINPPSHPIGVLVVLATPIKKLSKWQEIQLAIQCTVDTVSFFEQLQICGETGAGSSNHSQDILN